MCSIYIPHERYRSVTPFLNYEYEYIIATISIPPSRTVSKTQLLNLRTFSRLHFVNRG